MICAVVPAFNEADKIGEVVAQVRPLVDIVVVVNDGSTDDTANRAAAAGALVESLWPNRGKGAALAAGFDKALSLDAEAAITLDADGQHAPDDLPLFVEAYRQRGADLIIGERQYAQMPLARRIANASGRRILRAATGWDMPDNQSGYRLLSRRALTLLRPDRTDFAAEVEMIVRARGAGLSVEWIPIRTIYSDERSHFRPIHDTAAFLALAWQLWRRSSSSRRASGASA